MLWRVQNTDKYFLSSMHLLPEHDSELDARILGLLPQMSRVMFECDLSNATVPDFATYQDGCQLYEILPTDMYAKCARLWEGLNLGGNLGSCKPWWAALLISLATAIKNGFSLDRGVEKQLLVNISADRRAYLENPHMAMLPFEQAPISEQILFLKKSCAGEEAIMAEYRKIYSAWRSSDLTALSKILDDHMAILPSMYTTLIIRRNQMWAPEITELMTDPSPTLFVLGALHYVGSNRFPDCLDGPHKYVFQKVC